MGCGRSYPRWCATIEYWEILKLLRTDRAKVWRFSEKYAGMAIEAIFGAGDGIRTHDPNLGKVVLYP